MDSCAFLASAVGREGKRHTSKSVERTTVVVEQLRVAAAIGLEQDHREWSAPRKRKVVGLVDSPG